VAQVILSSIATSIMTVVSIVFAILLMTLTLASTQFSPRILISFVRDPHHAVDAWCFPRNIFILHGGIARRTCIAAPVRACRDRDGGDGTRAGLRGMADFLH